MKISPIFASLLLIFTLALAPAIATADHVGISIKVDVVCPIPNLDVLTNYGDYAEGNGKEMIHGQNMTEVRFKSSSLPAHMPNKLNNYRNESANYDSTTGQVSCSYTSTNPAEPRFTVSYTLTNGKGGTVLLQFNEFVTIKLPVGLHSS